MIIVLLIGILLTLGFIADMLYRWLYTIAKNQKVGFETIYDLIKEKK